MRLHRDSTPIPSANGFSLVEVLVAVAVLAVVALGAIGTLPNAYFTINKGGKISSMTHLAYEKLEQLRSSSATNWSHSDLTTGSHPSTPSAKIVGGEYADYSIEWTVIDGPVSGTMKTVILKVGYLLYDASGNPISANEARSQIYRTMMEKQ